MKFYKTDSLKEAAQMAAEDANRWNEEERHQLGFIASKYLGEESTNGEQFTTHSGTKRIIDLSNNSDYRSFVFEGEVYRFQNSAHGIGIKKLLPSSLSQFSEEQLVNELRRRGWNYILTEITDHDAIEGAKIKTSGLF